MPNQFRRRSEGAGGCGQQIASSWPVAGTRDVLHAARRNTSSASAQPAQALDFIPTSFHAGSHFTPPDCPHFPHWASHASNRLAWASFTPPKCVISWSMVQVKGPHSSVKALGHSHTCVPET